MKKSLKKLPVSCKALALFLLLLAGSEIVFAQETDEAEMLRQLGDTLLSFSDDLNTASEDYEAQRLSISLELDELQNLIKGQKIELQDALDSSNILKEKIQLSSEKQTELNLKYDEINLNFKKYVFQNKMQAVIPFLYAAGAVAISDGDLGETFIYGLAGYGTGALIENTGFGISRGVVWLKYERSF